MKIKGDKKLVLVKDEWIKNIDKIGLRNSGINFTKNKIYEFFFSYNKNVRADFTNTRLQKVKDKFCDTGEDAVYFGYIVKCFSKCILFNCDFCRTNLLIYKKKTFHRQIIGGYKISFTKRK